MYRHDVLGRMFTIGTLGLTMRSVLAAILAIFLAAPAMAQEPGGISTTVISRCAGKAGLDARQADSAFGVIMLDGMPWLTTEEIDEQVGSQKATMAVTGTGWMRRRNGSQVPIRFTCMLDGKGQALMFHAHKLLPGVRDGLGPARLLMGSVTYAEKMALPHGAELRVQLRDGAGSSPGTILAEQVVRSGWAVPIPFALRLPQDAPLQDRKLSLTASLVLDHQTLFQLGEPLALEGDALRQADMHLPNELVLRRVQTSKR
jgi:Type III secretion system lipoprotein chaperone (YscW)